MYSMEQGVRAEQKQILSPAMLQSLKVLQMTSADLYHYISKELLENPLISFDSVYYAEKSRRAKKKKTGSLMKDSSENFSTPVDEKENLKLQLCTMELDAETEKIAGLLCDTLDNKGYLDIALGFEIEKSYDVEKFNDAFTAVRELEPAGVGALDLRDSLLLQLARTGNNTGLAGEIVDNCLDLVAKNKLPEISKRCAVSLESVTHALDEIRRLNPNPVDLSTKGSVNGYIVPDVQVEQTPSGFAIRLNQLKPECIVMEEQYRNMREDIKSDGQVGQYIQKKMNSAHKIKSCLERRNITLEKCAKQLVMAQEKYFKYGAEQLKPYNRAKLAESIGMSVSTVSRALKDKYIECRWGLFPTSYFFPQATAANGQFLQKEKIYGLIKALIENEDKHKPISDAVLTKILCEKGFNVKRRTVDKYRDALHIPCASKRKKYNIESRP